MERLIPMMMFLMILAIGAIIRGASQKGSARSASSAARQRMEEDKQRVRESLMNRANQEMRARSAASSRPSRFEPEDEDKGLYYDPKNFAQPYKPSAFSDSEGWDSAQSFHEGEDPCHDDPDSFMTSIGGWDSAQSYHEGEDPCHDGMSPLSSAEPDSPAAIDYGRARELMRGIVISEVLTRRRRRTR
jgi:hypothetical protein